MGDDYVKSWQEMKAWTDANKAEADKLPRWGTFVTQSEALITQLKEMKRAKGASKGKLPASGNGSIHEFVESYNSLVESSNRVHDD